MVLPNVRDELLCAAGKVVEKIIPGGMESKNVLDRLRNAVRAVEEKEKESEITESDADEMLCAARKFLGVKS